MWFIEYTCILEIGYKFSWAESSEKAVAPHSSTLAWKIPWTEEPGRLQSMGSLGVRHDWATSLSLHFSCIGEGNGNPLQCSCLENPRDWGAWWAAVYGVAQSRTRLKWLSSSSRAESYLTIQNLSWWCYLLQFLLDMSCKLFFEFSVCVFYMVLIKLVTIKSVGF